MKEKEKTQKMHFFFSQSLSYDCVFFMDCKVVFTVWLVSEFEALFLYLKHYTWFFFFRFSLCFLCFFF